MSICICFKLNWEYRILQFIVSFKYPSVEVVAHQPSLCIFKLFVGLRKFLGNFLKEQF